MACCEKAIAILHYSYGGFHWHFLIGAVPYSPAVRESTVGRSQSDGMWAAFRLGRGQLVELADLGYGIHP